MLASPTTLTNAYSGYRKKNLFVGRVLLNKDNLVLKFSPVIFSYYLLSSATLVSRDWSISVSSQSKIQNNFSWFPTLKELFIFNFPLIYVLMIIPCWQLLTPKKFLYWLGNQKCHSKWMHNAAFPRLWLHPLGTAYWLVGTASLSLYKQIYY